MASTLFEVQVSLIGKNDRITTIEKSFKTEKARDKWIDKMEEDGRLYEVRGLRDS